MHYGELIFMNRGLKCCLLVEKNMKEYINMLTTFLISNYIVGIKLHNSVSNQSSVPAIQGFPKIKDFQ